MTKTVLSLLKVAAPRSFINFYFTDYLLCHDDQLENRKIAFILYLTESDWSNEDGGQLELFKCSSCK